MNNLTLQCNQEARNMFKNTLIFIDYSNKRCVYKFSLKKRHQMEGVVFGVNWKKIIKLVIEKGQLSKAKKLEAVDQEMEEGRNL